MVEPQEHARRVEYALLLVKHLRVAQVHKQLPPHQRVEQHVHPLRVLERLDEAHEHGVVHHLEHLHLALQAHLHLQLFHVRLVDGLQRKRLAGVLLVLHQAHQSKGARSQHADGLELVQFDLALALFGLRLLILRLHQVLHGAEVLGEVVAVDDEALHHAHGGDGGAARLVLNQRALPEESSLRELGNLLAVLGYCHLPALHHVERLPHLALLEDGLPFVVPHQCARRGQRLHLPVRQQVQDLHLPDDGLLELLGDDLLERA
mmetsp:Transcript_5086/g.9667  ORF Transcript_5086/g.9667 Transcript_5086/m.9667 type:complete len:262 (+) Transcript_5086:1278-2063(+)